MTETGSSGPADDIAEQAALWIGRMDGPDADRHRAQFDVWRSSSLSNQRAYDRLRQHLDAADILQQSPVTQQHLAKLGVGQTATRSRQMWLLAGAAIAALLLLTLGAGARSFERLSVGSAGDGVGLPIATDRGEIRTVRLADGSSVTLDTASVIRVAMTTTDRTLKLMSGRARIDVIFDPRPFHVEAGATDVTTRSAVFDVSTDDHQLLLVEMIKGQANVQPRLRDVVLTVSPTKLMSGQSVAYRLDRFEQSDALMPQPGLDQSQWPGGWVDCRSIPLRALVAEANRYALPPIVIDDRGLGELQITGRFKLNDTDKLVRGVADVFGLRVVHQDDGTHLRGK